MATLCACVFVCTLTDRWTACQSRRLETLDTHSNTVTKPWMKDRLNPTLMQHRCVLFMKLSSVFFCRGERDSKSAREKESFSLHCFPEWSCDLHTQRTSHLNFPWTDTSAHSQIYAADGFVACSLVSFSASSHLSIWIMIIMTATATLTEYFYIYCKSKNYYLSRR